MTRWELRALDVDRDERVARWFVAITGTGVALGLAFYAWCFLVTL